ncbi:polysaccharide deacetylase family protein [Paenibacillus sp. GYB003]|uniref:polysaccharide deacetylase family protein n=1 Tax=Paenibacillus sp. GYB003 TaxID=2994392 RepID=UPI002F96A0C1
MKNVKVIVIGAALTLATWGALSSGSLDAYVRSLGQSSGTAYRYVEPFDGPDPASRTTSIKPNEEQLLQSIKDEAEKRKEAPIDAKIDRVWKAIPGYNGIEVDIEGTWKLAMQRGTENGIPFVYKEIPPSVGLDDLGAEPIYKGNPKKPMAAFMINVAWGNEYIGTMLDVLEKEGVRATFFFDGSWLSKNVETAKTIRQKGHELSNHAYSHKDMSKLGREDTVREIERTQRLLKEQLGVDNTLFAPPSGDFSSLTVKVAHEMNLRTILWTLDTVDWTKPSSDSIVRKIAARVEPGALILMHPTASASGALEGMIKTIRDKGLVLGTVSEVISPNRVPKVEHP